MVSPPFATKGAPILVAVSVHFQFPLYINGDDTLSLDQLNPLTEQHKSSLSFPNWPWNVNGLAWHSVHHGVDSLAHHVDSARIVVDTVLNVIQPIQQVLVKQGILVERGHIALGYLEMVSTHEVLDLGQAYYGLNVLMVELTGVGLPKVGGQNLVQPPSVPYQMGSRYNADHFVVALQCNLGAEQRDEHCERDHAQRHDKDNGQLSHERGRPSVAKSG